MKTTLKLLTFLTLAMLTTSLNATAFETHVEEINATSEAVAYVSREEIVLSVDGDSFTFEANSSAFVKKVNEDMGGVISDVNPTNDDGLNLYDILAEQNKDVLFTSDVPSDVAVQTLIKVDTTTDSANDTINNITNKSNNFFHHRANQAQGEAETVGYENMNKIRQRGKFVKETLLCGDNQKHNQGDTTTCDGATTKTLVVFETDNCASGSRSSQGHIGECDLVTNTAPTCDDFTVNAEGYPTFTTSLASKIHDADGDDLTVTYIEVVKLSGDLIFDIPNTGVSGTDATITISNGSGTAYLAYRVKDSKGSNSTECRITITDLSM